MTKQQIEEHAQKAFKQGDDQGFARGLYEGRNEKQHFLREELDKAKRENNLLKERLQKFENIHRAIHTLTE